MSGMYYLFGQIWVWLAISFVAGAITHKVVFGRKNDEKVSTDVETQTSASDTKQVPDTALSDDWKPVLFTNAPEPSDDLKRIKGIGAVIEKTLNELGVYQFQQIADWDENNCIWVDNFLAFPGRIDRENWVDQAQILSRGETTNFAQRVDKGDVGYNK